jgi:2-C-methyl-D-erythritol 4-phosphate cytidylyltransferase
MNLSVIITAGGIGKRMESSIPKQFLPLLGKPVLLRTLERLYTILPHAQFILTLPTEWHAYWEKLVKKNACTIKHNVIDGGEERFHSVRNALNHADGAIVLVHDAVRPFVSHETITRCLKALESSPAAIPVTPVKESLREMVENENKALERSRFVLVQTPQCFQRVTLAEAYMQPYDATFTDDASVVEKAGSIITLVEGNEENIKITTPLDLQIAELLLRKMRIN